MALQPYDIQTERPTAGAFQQGLNRLVAQALAEKSLVWTALAGGIGLWTFALLHPDPLRLIAAGGYSVSIFIPILWKKG